MISPPAVYDRWLANIEPNPRDLLVMPFRSELMKIWPISTRVNTLQNDEASEPANNWSLNRRPDGASFVRLTSRRRIAF